MILPITHEYYAPWDSAINPAHFLYHRFGVSISHVDDQRVYKDSLIDKLVNEGGVFIERFKRINEDGTEQPEDDKDDGIPGMLKWSGDHGTASLFYKDHVICFNQTPGGWAVNDWFKTGEESLLPGFKTHLADTKGAAVSIVLQSQGGMYTKSVDFKTPVIDDLTLNYGDGFEKVHKTIVSKLEANKSGAIIFHGAPGCGKSFYIKHLTTLIDREFIYIPVGLAGELATPAFITLLMEHKDAVVILEDAEQAVQSRELETGNASTVSTLLNLSDGILGSLLNLTIVLTYNADKKTIDSALTRKGRLMLDYTFAKLSSEAAQRLAKHLGKSYPDRFVEPTSLADVYNADDDTGYVAPIEKVMGFGAI